MILRKNLIVATEGKHLGKLEAEKIHEAGGESETIDISSPIS
jgi:hypothetical protein